ncbi:nucleoside phosphorylase [Herbivorax sp. ANBcel31]|uniref:nucleoside phosphorylase n=1 Tax=Herbivorax sp. ANBcel31 TaxID=3069754 RepID=UPI0027B1D3BA|nr:nucleoside phosphorylase [Herbivorax sp. ANBcel31]MDQ2085334.1 nucleoside phosphorylase [Herbivorax sp. ANBcel31]
MINETFDIKTDAIINPESCYGYRNKICDICIVTFSNVVVDNILNKFKCTQIATISSANGNFPIYKFKYKEKEIAFYMSMVTSTGAGTFIEEARCLTGATKYIMFGSCGTLNKEITAGKLIVPTAAYRDEGFSYHYAQANDYIKIKNADFVAKTFDELGLPYVMGKTWTTDGIYRETRANMEKRKAEGCIAVEMECAGVQAVCDFRGIELYNFLISGDLLDAPEWDRRILGNEEEKNHQIKSFLIALELSLKI